MSREVYLHQCIVQDDISAEGKAAPPDSLVGTLCVQRIGGLLNSLNFSPARDCPLFFGSGFGVLANLHDFDRVSVEKGPLHVNPSRFPDTVLNAPACRASIAYRLTGPIYNVSNGRTSALDALGLAMMQMEAGQINEAIVCAAEEASAVAQRIEPSLTRSSGAALYLSCKESAVRLWDYRKERVESDDCPDCFEAGCVQPLRTLHRVFTGKKDTELILSTQQDGCRSSVRVLQSETHCGRFGTSFLPSQNVRCMEKGTVKK